MTLRPVEREVLRLLGRGSSAAEIADTLAIDAAMAGVYCRNMMRKLQLGDVLSKISPLRPAPL